MPRQLQSPLIYVFLTIALIGYFLPWLITPTGGLQMGAYDLAEWSSLIPSVRQSAPFLWSVLALRVPLAIIGVIFSIITAKNRRTWAIAILLLTAIALLPPLEFFTIYRDDVNYRQQFIIAVCTLFIGSVSILQQGQSKLRLLIIILCTGGCIACGIGMTQAYWFMQDFKLPVTIGLGGFMTIIGLLAIAMLGIIKQSRS